MASPVIGDLVLKPEKGRANISPNITNSIVSFKESVSGDGHLDGEQVYGCFFELCRPPIIARGS